MTNPVEAISLEVIEKCFEDIKMGLKKHKELEENIKESSQKFIQELDDINENFKNH